jgi:ATP/maltotriose-dependent transcriptional regulator MalT
VAGELEPARAFGEEVLSLAKKTDDPALLVPAYHALGYTLCYTADYLDALELARAGIALHDFETERKNVQLFQFSSTVAMHHFAANSLWMLGYPDRAQDEVSRAVALAEALSHPPSLAYAKSALTWGVPFLRGEHHAVKLAATEAISLSREEAFSLWPPLVRTFRAWSTVADGDVQEGLAQMRESLAAYRASGGGILQTSIAALLAEATWKSGDSAAALQILADALSSVVATQEHNYEPELYRIRGIVLASSAGRNLGGPVDADESFRAALDLARRQRSKSLELRAAVSFAEFTAARGRAEEGRQILAEIYAWFSEGFDSPDLLAAKALLDSR